MDFLPGRKAQPVVVTTQSINDLPIAAEKPWFRRAPTNPAFELTGPDGNTAPADRGKERWQIGVTLPLLIGQVSGWACRAKLRISHQN